MLLSRMGEPVKRLLSVIFILILLSSAAACTVSDALDIEYLPVYVVEISPPPATPTVPPLPLPTPSPEPEDEAEEAVAVLAMGETRNVLNVTEEELILAAKVAYFENGVGGERACRAVLSVIYNRCMAPNWGGGVTSITQVVYHPGQFSVIHGKRFESFVPPAEIVEYARDVFINGNLSIPYNVMFFGASWAVPTDWGGRTMYKKIGDDYFFYGPTGGYAPTATPKP